jgi:hypothetical protein
MAKNIREARDRMRLDRKSVPPSIVTALPSARNGSRNSPWRPSSFRFALKVGLDTRTDGKAELQVTTVPPKFEPALYEFYVDYSVGESPTPKTGTVTLKLQVK